MYSIQSIIYNSKKRNSNRKQKEHWSTDLSAFHIALISLSNIFTKPLQRMFTFLFTCTSNPYQFYRLDEFSPDQMTSPRHLRFSIVELKCLVGLHLIYLYIGTRDCKIPLIYAGCHGVLYTYQKAVNEFKRHLYQTTPSLWVSSTSVSEISRFLVQILKWHEDDFLIYV